MASQSAVYEGANREEAFAHFRDDMGKARTSGFSPTRRDWSERDGKAVLTVEYESVFYDKEDQYQQITPWLLSDERLHAVFDCKGAGTGFVAVTNKRLMFYDKAFLGKRKALTSVPFDKITAVSSVDEGRGLFGATSGLVVKTGSEAYEFEFRGGDKAQRAYQLIMGELLEHEP